MCGVPWTLPESFTTSLRPVSVDSSGTVPSLVGTAVLAGQPGNSERAEESYVAWNDLGLRVEEACVSSGDGTGHSSAAAPSVADCTVPPRSPITGLCLQSAAVGGNTRLPLSLFLNCTYKSVSYMGHRAVQLLKRKFK